MQRIGLLFSPLGLLGQRRCRTAKERQQRPESKLARMMAVFTMRVIEICFMMVSISVMK